MRCSRAFLEAVAQLAPLPLQQRVTGFADLLLARPEPGREPRPQVREAVRQKFGSALGTAIAAGVGSADTA